MAFVYRAPRKEDKSSTAEFVGPGAYTEIIDEVSSSVIGGVRNLKPFNSTVIKN